MLIIGEGGHMSGASEVGRVHSLAADLDRIVEGSAPTPEELANAPLLEAWSVVTMPVAFLVGTVTGHPILCGPLIHTSDLWALAPELGWAHTLSRFYRLGAPRAPGSVNPGAHPQGPRMSSPRNGA